MIEQTLYLIRGISGTGKSTLARALSQYAVSADDMPGLYDDNSNYQVDLQAESHRWCLSIVTWWMEQQRFSIAVANTFTKQKYFQEYLDLAKKYQYAVHIIHCEAVLFPSGNQASSIHNLSEEVLQRQRDNWELWH
jgi:predicted kinase